MSSRDVGSASSSSKWARGSLQPSSGLLSWDWRAELARPPRSGFRRIQLASCRHRARIVCCARPRRMPSCSSPGARPGERARSKLPSPWLSTLSRVASGGSKEKPRAGRGFLLRKHLEGELQTPRYYPKAQIRQGAEPNATFRVGADGETGDFKGFTLSNSGPRLLRKPGAFLQAMTN